MATFFAQHAKYAPSMGADFEVAEQGVYTCILSEVKPEERPDFDNPEVMVPQLVWVFETIDRTDSQGQPFRFVKFTGVKYGNDNANLTILMDSMVGRRLTQTEFQGLDLEELKQARYRVMVDEITNKKGKPANKIMSVKPQGAARQQTQPVQNARQAPAPSQPVNRPQRGPIPTPTDKYAEDEDPFGDE